MFLYNAMLPVHKSRAPMLNLFFELLIKVICMIAPKQPPNPKLSRHNITDTHSKNSTTRRMSVKSGGAPAHCTSASGAWSSRPGSR